jgi:putative peptidoglycan lipid II flippase
MRDVPRTAAGMPSSADKPSRSIVHLIITLMSGALLSKVLGFVREILMALVIGTAVVADAFRASITLVLLPISFFQAEMVPAVLIPMQQEAIRNGRGPITLGALSVALASISAVLMALLQGLGFVLVAAVVPGFSLSDQALTFSFVQIMALAMPASVLLNVLASAEIARGRGRIANARAAFQNVSVLTGIAGVTLGGDFILLAWAFAISFNAVGLWAIVLLIRDGSMTFRGLRRRDVVAAGREFFVRLKPFIPLPIAEQANIWVERLFASRLQVGAIASLDYARTMTECFQLLVSQPVGLAVLAHASRDRQEEQAALITRLVLAFALPTCAFLFVFSTDIVSIVFRRGAFGETGVLLTGNALQGISIGLWASTLGWILLRLLNNANRNRRAALIIILSYVSGIAFNTLVFGAIVPANAAGGDIILIGMGESVRALVLLGGVILSMQNGLRLLPLIAIGAVPAALMLGAGFVIEQMVTGIVPRILCGGVVLAADLALALALLMPSAYGMISARLRQKRA